MSGTTPTKAPKNNAELMRNVVQKQADDEHQTSSRVGDWTFSTQDETGNLLASHVGGGSVVLAEPPDAGDDPDRVDTNDQPAIKVERVNNQQGSRGSGVLVQWDTVSYQSGGWGFAPVGTDLVIPTDGVYLIQYSLYMLNQSTVVNKAILLINAQVKLAQEVNGNGGAVYPSFHLSQIFSLAADTIVSAAAYVAGSGTMDFGASGADPTAYTALSLVRLPVG